MANKLIILQSSMGFYGSFEANINGLLELLKDHVIYPIQYIHDGDDVLAFIHYDEAGFSKIGKDSIQKYISEIRDFEKEIFPKRS